MNIYPTINILGKNDGKESLHQYLKRWICTLYLCRDDTFCATRCWKRKDLVQSQTSDWRISVEYRQNLHKNPNNVAVTQNKMSSDLLQDDWGKSRESLERVKSSFDCQVSTHQNPALVSSYSSTLIEFMNWIAWTSALWTRFPSCRKCVYAVNWENA